MDNTALIDKIREKKEFQNLPESLIFKVLNLKEINKKNGEDKIKESRAFLRKYFSVFITNKLIKGKLQDGEILKKHISSKRRNYVHLYNRILKNEGAVIDLGAGMNGFSYKYLNNVRYVAIEAIKVFVEAMNHYFKENSLNALAFQEDLFNLDKVLEIIKNERGKKVVFMFNLIDALEKIERDYSKKLILEASKNVDKIVLSLPTKSLSGKTIFHTNREWILSFLKENFFILDDFEEFGERFIVFRKR